jgi:hypothetical protein
VLLACMLLVSARWMRDVAAEQTAASLNELKVAYTFHFLELIQWENEGPNLDFCAYSDSAAGDSMVKAFSGRKIRNMKITTRRIAPDQPGIASCKAIFIPENAAPDVPDLLKRLKNTPTVTISGVPDFVSAGGIIGLVRVGDQLRFEVNMRAARQSNLKISARLLELARRVVS